MCASFAPPKPPSAFTVGKTGQETTGASRRRQNSTPRRSRSPSPLSNESLHGIGGHAFGKEDFAKALSAAASRGGGGGGGGGGSRGFATAEGGTPTPLSIGQTLNARGGYSLERPGPLTAPATMPATVPLVSPTGDERPAGFRSSFAATAATAAAAAAPAGFAADSPTATAGGAARTRSFTAAAAAASAASAGSHPIVTIPTFSEIAQGAMRAGGDLASEPFARARVRAAEERWARKEAERLERDGRRRVKALSCATLLVLAVVLACRCFGVGITVSGTAPPQGFLSSAVGDLPAIASSRNEFVAALKLAGLKKPKPAKVDRAWSALASGENRGRGGGDGEAVGMYYIRGCVLAATVVVAGVLRNPDFAALLAAAVLATLVLFPRRRRRRSSGRSAVGSGGGGGGGGCGDDWAARGGGEATNGGGGGGGGGGGSTRAAGQLRPGSRGAGGVGAANGGRAGDGVAGGSSSSAPRVRGASSLSPRLMGT